MAIEVIPLSRLQSEASGLLARCCDSGEPVIVELPDHRLVTIQPLDAAEVPDSLVDDLIASHEGFRQLLQASRDAAKRPFVPGS